MLIYQRDTGMNHIRRESRGNLSSVLPLRSTVHDAARRRLSAAFGMRRPYRTISTNLLPSEVAAADRIVDVLREEGWPYANRSLVVREAIERLSEELRHKTPEEVFQYFIKRRGRRIHEKE